MSIKRIRKVFSQFRSDVSELEKRLGVAVIPTGLLAGTRPTVVEKGKSYHVEFEITHTGEQYLTVEELIVTELRRPRLADGQIQGGAEGGSKRYPEVPLQDM